MASIIKTSIDLTKIDKTKIIDGKKGKYLPITITINDELDNFGNQGPVIVEQSKEEREAKEAKTNLGNVRVLWTNGEFPSPPPRENNPQQAPPQKQAAPAMPDDLPF